MGNQGTVGDGGRKCLILGQFLAQPTASCYPQKAVGNALDFLEVVRRERGAALMGIVNATPDSFYDGGRFDEADAARRHVDALLAAGADLVDIGGESTRPGAEPVAEAEQLRRIEPALTHALERGAFVSVDTTLPGVARRALALGAHIINDVSCLANPELAEVVAEKRGVLLLMHSRGDMVHMPGFSQYPDDGYDDVVGNVRSEWRAARDRAVQAGLPAQSVWIDPGLGFQKNARHSLTLLAHLRDFAREGVPLVVGPSRKSFIASLDGSSPEQRLGGTLAACLHAVTEGASVLRVHDVREARQALLLWREVHRGPTRTGGSHDA